MAWLVAFQWFNCIRLIGCCLFNSYWLVSSLTSLKHEHDKCIISLLDNNIYQVKVIHLIYVSPKFLFDREV